MAFTVEEGLIIDESQTANILLVGLLAEGILTTLVGKLIRWIHPNLMFYSLTVFAFNMWGILR